MSHLIVNPYWNVPDLDRHATRCCRRSGQPRAISPAAAIRSSRGSAARCGRSIPYWVDWYAVNPRPIQIRQVPGDFNALGRIKFMFPNQHSVYLHDTPSKRLFQRDYRALQPRLRQGGKPARLRRRDPAVAAPDWNSKRLEKLYGGAERRVNLDTPIPVHLAYFTAWVGAGRRAAALRGHLRLRRRDDRASRLS